MSNVPDSFIPLEGWRLFNYDLDDHILRSLAITYGWESAEPERAKCISMNFLTRDIMFSTLHDSPNMTCSCGYYAFKDKEQAIYECKLTWDYHTKERTIPVVGRVEMWGKIIIHDGGYRAEYIKLLGLAVPAFTTVEHGISLHRKYGVKISMIEGSEKWQTLDSHKEKSLSNLYGNQYNYNQSSYQQLQILIQQQNQKEKESPSIVQPKLVRTPNEVYEMMRKEKVKNQKDYREYLKKLLKGDK